MGNISQALQKQMEAEKANAGLSKEELESIDRLHKQELEALRASVASEAASLKALHEQVRALPAIRLVGGG